MKNYVSEFLGTLVLVLVGCGVAVLTGANVVATSLAFGLSVVAMAYSVGSISGGHFNPAITLGMLVDKRIKGREACLYMVSQVLGALCGSIILYFIFKGSNVGVTNLGANGYGASSASDISLVGALVVEAILTCIFVLVALFASGDENNNHAGLVIGLTLVLVHLIGIGLTGTSVNPARSLAPAILQGGKALEEVWMFIVAPLVGSALAVCTYKFFEKK